MKHTAAAAALLMVLSALMCAAAIAPGSDGSGVSSPSMKITGDDNVSSEDSSDYEVLFIEQTPFESGTFDLYYTATLYRDGKAVADAVSPSTGGMSNDSAVTLTVSKQSAGTYELRVDFTETVKFEGEDETQTFHHSHSKYFSVLDPLKFNVDLKNDGTIGLNQAHVVFYLDGVKIEGSDVEFSVDAGSTYTVSYSYLPVDLSKGKHTYYIVATDGSIIDGIGPEHANTFYYKQGSYDFLNWVGVIVVIVLAVLIAWVLTKPVKNLGKPKARKARKA